MLKRFGKFVPLHIEILRRAKKRFGKFSKVGLGRIYGGKSQTVAKLVSLANFGDF